MKLIAETKRILKTLFTTTPLVRDRNTKNRRSRDIEVPENYDIIILYDCNRVVFNTRIAHEIV